MDTDNKDKQEVMDHDHEEHYEEVEKMKSSSPSKSCEVYAEPVAVRECNICGKTFGNGKALGGHRRSHFQAAKKHSQKVKTRFSNLPKRSNNNKAICDDDDDDGKHICYLCKKDFPSKNALFGHMRSHPERDWRGVCPPTIHTDNKNTSSCSLSSDSMEKYKESDYDDDYVGKDIAPNDPPTIDLSKPSLPRWQKTDKRGRRSIGAYEAAENLVYIRCNYFCAESVVNPKSPEAPNPCKEKGIAEEPLTSEKHVLKKIKFYVSGSLNREKGSSEIRDEKISANMDEKEEADWAKEKYYVKNTESMNTEARQDDVGFFDERIKEMMLLKKKNNKGKKIKKLLLKPKTPDSESEDKGFLDKTEKKLNGYECDNCCKSFPTFQALGGHKSIHNKPKPSDAIAEDNNCKDSHAKGLLMEEEANNTGTETLVGTLPLNNEEASSSSQFVGPKILDFDLNKSPDDMHDD